MTREYVKKIILFYLIILFLVLGIIGYAYLNSEYGIGIPCIVNEVFGLHCSGCGLTRAVGAILKLDFYQAIRYNAFSLILLPLLLIAIVTSIWEYMFDKRSFFSKIPSNFWIVLFSIVFIYGIVRNFIPELQPIKL